MKRISFSILTSDEVHTSALRIQNIVLLYLDDDPFMIIVIPLLKTWSSNLSLSLGKITDKEAVKILEQKDTIRDCLFVSLRDYCKSFSNKTDPTLSRAGKQLTQLFHDLGWTMYKLGYVTETSQVKALIDKLESAPYKNALTTINGTTGLTELKAANDDFETTFKEKVDSRTSEEYHRIQECRGNIARYVDSLLGYIDVMAEAKRGVYTEAVEKIDEVVTEVLTIAHARQTKKENEKKEGKTEEKTKS